MGRYGLASASAGGIVSILAAALILRCSHLATEDLQHGQAVGELKIIDPFRVDPETLATLPDQVLNMGFRCGIVGLPNVGKSTLFNALTRTAAAQAANYPFCTIEPNTGEVAVPDPRLDKLAALGKSAEIIPTRITFVDIAGLVRGASKGEGLGNQFLANIREVDAIAHVLRCFEDPDVVHVEGTIDPVADAETVETELMLADLESLDRRIQPLRKKATAKDKEALTLLPVMEKALAVLHRRQAGARAAAASSRRKTSASSTACSS